MDEAFLIFYLRPSRRKARAAATAEALSLLRDLRPTAPVGGPLAERGGLFWITLPAAALERACARLPRLGYTHAVDRVEAVSSSAGSSEEAPVRWRRQRCRLVPLYREDAGAFRQVAPDRRVFLLEAGGEVRAVRGYRGSSDPLSRRGLPVEDARLLVNLTAFAGAVFLDPFAGAGGIVLEALACGCCVLSADIDPALRFGLAHLGARHCVADARALPFVEGAFDAIATEPPYDAQAKETVCAALREMGRVLKPGGRLALYCAASQSASLREVGRALGLACLLDAPINRKGTECAALVWQKPGGADGSHGRPG